jgi:hypothetical protein
MFSNSSTDMNFPNICSRCALNSDGLGKWPVSKSIANGTLSTEVPICGTCLAEIEAVKKRSWKGFWISMGIGVVAGGLFLAGIMSSDPSYSFLTNFMGGAIALGLPLGLVVGGLVMIRMRRKGNPKFVWFDTFGNLRFRNAEYDALFARLNRRSPF